ncbi:hypothetical protein B5D82_05290 [Cognaticolwellia beringensis]|uniref:Secreted protein n=1 Tax=Cognaticolwellia beringensis TaxID=1967665 RepID=A0A222G6J8_9GAMM|nr:hypothetical protein B5D82_05290 [Cognaticolwellia beringensis]
MVAYKKLLNLFKSFFFTFFILNNSFTAQVKSINSFQSMMFLKPMGNSVTCLQRTTIDTRTKRFNNKLKQT